MVNINLCFRVDCPVLLNDFTVFDIGKNSEYFDSPKKRFSDFANNCLHANGLILRKLEENLNLRVSYALSGSAIDVFEKNFPEVIKSFRKIAKTGNAEFLAMPYFSQLSCLYSKNEFEEQVKIHSQKIKQLFGFQTKFFFADTGLTKDLIKNIEKIKLKGILAKDSFHNNNHIYKLNGSKIKIILKNSYLSSCINQQFSNINWKEWPLTSEKYAGWINREGFQAECINLVIDYDSFGIRHPKSSRIFSLFAELPEELLKNPANMFRTPSELADLYKSQNKFNPQKQIKKISGGRLQINALEKIYSLESGIKKAENSTLNAWRNLQHPSIISSLSKNKNPQESYENYIRLSNILEDLRHKIGKIPEKTPKKHVIKQKNQNEKINKDQIKRIYAETQEEIIRNLKEVYKFG